MYVQAVADLPDLSPEDTDRLPLLCDWMTEVGCGGRDYRATQAWQAAVTGGISADASVRASVSATDRARGLFVLSGKALARNADGLAEVLRETFLPSRAIAGAAEGPPPPICTVAGNTGKSASALEHSRAAPSATGCSTSIPRRAP